MTTLQRLWRGELPLPQAFWVWAVIGGLLVNGATSALFLTLLVGGQILVFVHVHEPLRRIVGTVRPGEGYFQKKRLAL